jgi:hypothetical protein
VKWILILWLQGWGYGLGSTGNAIAVAEFATHEKCANAAREFRKQVDKGANAICVEK